MNKGPNDPLIFKEIAAMFPDAPNEREIKEIAESLEKFIKEKKLEEVVSFRVFKDGQVDIVLSVKRNYECVSITAEDKKAAMIFLTGVWLGGYVYERNRPNND